MNRTEPTLADVTPADEAPATPPMHMPAAAQISPLAAPEPSQAVAPQPAPPQPAAPQPATALPTAAPAPVAPVAVAPVAVAPKPALLRLVLQRSIRSGLIGGKKFELTMRVDSSRDLRNLFKGHPDELLLAYKSTFADKSYALRRSEFLRGAKFTPASLNEMIELEERLQMGFDQLRRMIDIVEGGDAEVVIEA